MLIGKLDKIYERERRQQPSFGPFAFLAHCVTHAAPAVTLSVVDVLAPFFHVLLVAILK